MKPVNAMKVINTNAKVSIPFVSSLVGFEMYLKLLDEAVDKLNLRENPSLDSEVLLQLETGDIITLLAGPEYDPETKYSWMKVQDMETNMVGFLVENHTWYAPVEE